MHRYKTTDRDLTKVGLSAFVKSKCTLMPPYIFHAAMPSTCIYKCAIHYVLSYHEKIHFFVFDSNLHNNEGLINNSINYKIY